MDPETLVERQIEGGQQLIDRLSAEGVTVLAACWAKGTFAGQWYLYVATPLVGADGVASAAYRRLHEILRDPPKELPRIDSLEVKMIGAVDPVAKAVLKIQKVYARRLPGRFPANHFPGAFVEEAYVYPPVAAPVS